MDIRVVNYKRIRIILGPPETARAYDLNPDQAKDLRDQIDKALGEVK